MARVENIRANEFHFLAPTRLCAAFSSATQHAMSRANGMECEERDVLNKVCCEGIDAKLLFARIHHNSK